MTENECALRGGREWDPNLSWEFWPGQEESLQGRQEQAGC